MEAKYLSEAIKKLIPNAEFSFIDADYSTIKWDVLEGEAPTKLEIEQAIKEIKLNEAKKISELAENKAKAEAKLAALGLTADDLKALGLG